MYRWEDRHGEMSTWLRAYCEDCGLARRDVAGQTCNVRHPDGRLQAEALMLAVASYGRCHRCESTDIAFFSPGEIDAMKREHYPAGAY